MLIGQMISIFVVFAGLTATYFPLRKKINVEKYLKIISLVLAGVFFFRYMLGDDLIRETQQLQSTIIPSGAITFFSLVCVWSLYSLIFLVVLFPFFKDSKFVTIIKFYGFFVTILNVGFLFYTTKAICGSGVYQHFSIRALLMGFELAILLHYCLVVFMENGKFKVSKDDWWCILYVVGMLLATMPSYMLKGLFGDLNYGIKVKGFEFPHRIVIYFSIIIPCVLYLLLRKKDKHIIRGILLYISLGTLMSFSLNFKFEDFLDVTHWPFHLCNTAMYLIPLCLIFKWKKLFYFTFFVNVIGAFIAMVLPSYSPDLNMFSERVVSFYINHYIAFFMPVLMVALRVFERPKLKEFQYSMVGFVIYFALVLVLNAWFTNYGEVDYFYINTDFIAKKLGKWSEDQRDIVWSFNIGKLTFTFYPLYQFCFFLIYVVLAGGMWFLYEGGFSLADLVYDILGRKKKIKLDRLALESNLKGEVMKPLHEENKNKIVLTNFSKRYGNSKNFAVKDASLEIKSGEIFGFLGHNGAGKSTIIKSIVGIQPITSGTIEVCGYDVDKQAVMAKKQIGFVPDNYALYEKLSGREYINYIADLYDVSLEDRNLAIEKYVNLFELKDAFDHQIKTYSHGMKQKIAIISALVHNPKVWILDEPLTGLDPNSIFQVKECMKQHAKAGNIVFFSSHLIDIIEHICDKIAIIKNGEIIACESVKKIEKKCSLEEYYMKMTGFEKTEEIPSKKRKKVVGGGL